MYFKQEREKKIHLNPMKPSYQLQFLKDKTEYWYKESKTDFFHFLPTVRHAF